jgi:hypothetical protein
MKVLQAYCFKCRTMRGIRNPSQVTLKNGRPATRGHCPVCYSRVFRICPSLTRSTTAWSGDRG